MSPRDKLAGAFFVALLALIALVQRRGADRVAAVPPLLIGAGLLVSNAVVQGRRRRRLLETLRQQEIGR